MTICPTHRTPFIPLFPVQPACPAHNTHLVGYPESFCAGYTSDSCPGALKKKHPRARLSRVRLLSRYYPSSPSRMTTSVHFILQLVPA